jgi:galactokinase/mevalonate kinase-like predicted kinase
MIQTLLTVPPALADFVRSSAHVKPSWLGRLGGGGTDTLFISADPAGQRLGSGGGTVNLLHEAWRATGRTQSLEEWLCSSQKLVLHSGGESRRLPAYAAVGKAFLPLPSIEGLKPRLHDQVLADFQLPSYRQTLVEAGKAARVLVTSGDVWLDFDSTCVPEVDADISGIGMRVTPEVAQHFGVYFVERKGRDTGSQARPIAFFLQKPSPAEITQHAVRYDFFVDTGMWLLSVKALQVLFARCGWSEKTQSFRSKNGLPTPLDLYTEVGAALGASAKITPALSRAGFEKLSTSVVPLANARFYHLGSSRQLLESMEQLQWQALTPQKSFYIATRESPSEQLRPKTPNWVEGCSSASLPQLGGTSLITGLPSGAKISSVPPEVCVDVAPVDRDHFVLRVYCVDDTLRGPLDRATICGTPAGDWLRARGIRATADDIFRQPVYPLLHAEEINDAAIAWFLSDALEPGSVSAFGSKTLLSAAEIPNRVNFARYFEQRRSAYAAALQRSFEAVILIGDESVFAQDFSALANFCLTESPELRRWIMSRSDDLRAAIKQAEHRARFLMLQSQFARGPEQKTHRAESFRELQSALVSANQLTKSAPQLALKEDQIVWARSPIRLDLAGGWTDTPPYCLEAGGTVLNLAALLNGQPPIQVFIRRTTEHVIQLRSIDLGSAETVHDFDGVRDFRNPAGNFSLPKAALAMAGFVPEFNNAKPERNLPAQLKRLGGGLEISLLSAVPKGSGLGTSSILAATLLGAINRACALGWDDVDLYNRVLGVEQLLTTGGGWQDQAGALFPGVKLIETRPGLTQSPTVRYLSPTTLESAIQAGRMLLYYTGATRMAKGILQEIVRDMFLGCARTHRTLTAIRANAWQAFHALQLNDFETLQRCIGRSWRLNKELDPGTTTPEIEQIIHTCGSDLTACKLLGAGGGGFMLMCAKDSASGARLRAKLDESPPNRRARFVELTVASRGLEVTVS